MQLPKQIIFRARQQEDEPAIATVASVVKYRALAKSVEAAIDALADVRASADSMVIIDVADPLQHMALLIALGLMGQPTASIMNGARTAEFGACDVLLTDREDSPVEAARVRRVEMGWFKSDSDAAPDYRRLLALPGYASSQSAARYMVSSGTTGRPKVIGFTADLLERRMLSSTLLFAGGHALRAATLNIMDPSTISGFQSAFRTLCCGGVLCLPGNLATALDMIRLFQVEYLMGSAGQLTALARMLRGKPALHSIKTIYMTGARVAPEALLAIQAQLCSHIWCGYASTESGVMAIGTAADLRRAEGSTGFLVPGVEMQATDEGGVALPPGDEGLLRVRTDRAAFYRGTAGKRIETAPDGWFVTGDIGRVYPSGLLTVVGRAGDVVNRGGVITAPDYIEDGLRADPRIRDAATVAINANGRQEVWAAIVADIPLDPVELLRATRIRMAEKAPDRIVQVSAIPRNANAKIQRHLVREQLGAMVKPRAGEGEGAAGSLKW